MKRSPLRKTSTKRAKEQRRDFGPMIGRRYGRLMVVSAAETYVSPKGQTQTRWNCRCDCGNTSTPTRCALNRGTTLSCGCLMDEIKRRKKPKPSESEMKASFWRRVEIKGEDECWPWRMGKTTRGYGVVWFAGRKYKTHRLALQLTLGRELNADELACHRCDNPPCCNPAHIYAGTPKQNTADCLARNRANREMGSKRYNAKLTEEQVERIKREAPFRTYGWGRRIAKEMGVGRSAVSNIVAGLRWKQVAPAAEFNVYPA